MLPRCLWAITDVSLTFHTFLSGWHLYCHSITCDHYRVKAFHWWWWMFRVISQAVELLKGCFIQHATEHNVFSHLGCGRIPKTDFGYVFCLLGYLIVMLCLVTITTGHSSQFTVLKWCLKHLTNTEIQFTIQKCPFLMNSSAVGFWKVVHFWIVMYLCITTPQFKRQ